MEKIVQSDLVNILQVKKTVDWLVNNTTVSVFDPIKFNGYQRQIDSKHCKRIIEYLSNDFFLPSSIICATDDEFNDNLKLRIVDGQHRIHAFRMMAEENPSRYNEIKNKELSVIVMEKVDEKIEIDTFITINKTSKKVDTSLAYVLKNKQNSNSNSKELNISKREYLAVELARLMNTGERNDANEKKDTKDDIWLNRILYEGNPKNTMQLISLNAFVKSTRIFLSFLERLGVIAMDWQNDEEIEKCLEKILDITDQVWHSVKKKWPELFEGDLEKRRIIQGAIGYTSINRVIIEKIKKLDNISNIEADELKRYIEKWILSINIEVVNWEPGKFYSKFSSESGYNIVAQELLKSMR